MKIVKVNAVSNSQRHHIKLSKEELVKKSRFLKGGCSKKVSSYGRSSLFGRITSWHKQRGKKKLYRSLEISNEQRKSMVLGVSYDPNRSSFVSINFDFLTNEFYYDLCTSQVYAGSLTETNKDLRERWLGFRSTLKNLPVGSLIHSVGLSKPQYAKSAGTFVQLIQKGKDFSKIKLPSRKLVNVSSKSYGTLGSVSNNQHNLLCIGKAGRNRNLGRRPIVRGVAMNPVDHPHGGRTPGGCVYSTPWGIPTKCKFSLKRKKRKKNKK
jgi:large subunit ribosomal protein L2